MKRKGFLDDIEKVVDDFSPKDKKQINSRVDRYKENFSDWFNMEQRRSDEYRAQRFHKEYIREHLLGGGWSTTTSPKHKDIYKCECGIEIEIFYIKDEHDVRDYDWRTDSYRTRRGEITEIDRFHCPQCTRQIRVAGKVTDLKVKMTE